MFNKKDSLIWGGVLIVLGLLLLVDSLSLVPDFSPLVWAFIMGVMCLAFTALYLYRGKDNWGWYFPIFISGGLTVSAVMRWFELESLWIGASFMALISLPFWLTYLVDRTNNWWALIPGWATAVIALIVLVGEKWQGETVGALVMWAIALPFLFVYMRNRQHWWALIPGFITAGIGVVVLMTGQRQEDLIAVIVLLVIAAPFVAVYFLAREQWWAIIPAGILTTLAIIVPFASRIEGDTSDERLVAVVMFLGFSVPFGWLWFRRERFQTGWAKYPAVGLLAASLFTLALGTVIQNSWPIILILVGVWLLIDNFRQPKLK